MIIINKEKLKIVGMQATHSPWTAALLPWINLLDEDRVVLDGSLDTVG